MAQGRQALGMAALVFVVVGAISYFTLPNDPPPEVCISTNPAKAMVIANGKYVGLSPAYVPARTGDKIVVRTIKKNYAQWAGILHVEDTKQHFLLDLTSRGNASIEITSTPSAAQVYINGIRSGTTPYIARNLFPDEYQIAVERPGCEPQTKKIAVEEGGEQRVNFVLQSSKELMLKRQIAQAPHDVSNYMVLATEYLNAGKTADAVNTFVEGIRNWDGIYDFDVRRNGVNKLYGQLLQDPEASALLGECCLQKIAEEPDNPVLGQVMLRFAQDPAETVDWLGKQLETPRTALEQRVLNWLLAHYLTTFAPEYSRKLELYDRFTSEHPSAAVSLETRVAILLSIKAPDHLDRIYKLLAELPPDKQEKAKIVVVEYMANARRLHPPIDLARDVLEKQPTPELVERLIPALAVGGLPNFIDRFAKEHPDLAREKSSAFALAYNRVHKKDEAHQYAPEVYTGEMEEPPALEAEPQAIKAYKAAKGEIEKMKQVMANYPGTIAACQSYLMIIPNDPIEATILIKANAGKYRRKSMDLLYLAAIYMRNLLDTDNGIPAMKEYLDYQKQFWPTEQRVLAIEMIANAYLRGRGEPEKAIEWYEKYFDECSRMGLFPQPEALLHTGLAYCRAGHKEKALAYWQQVNRQFPWDADAVQARYLAHFYYGIENLMP